MLGLLYSSARLRINVYTLILVINVMTWCTCLSVFVLQVEEGNVEYKLKLLNPNPSRFEHLVTQMKWRLQEGQGEAIYKIGVTDCGFLRGLSEQEMEDSIATLKKMAERYSTNYHISCLDTVSVVM